MQRISRTLKNGQETEITSERIHSLRLLPNLLSNPFYKLTSWQQVSEVSNHAAAHYRISNNSYRSCNILLSHSTAKVNRFTVELKIWNGPARLLGNYSKF